ncbi:MAG: hypothetical protein JKX93_08495 [Rhizobiaceae bacterium]|nr:hypothetical protein [Rhizobiaceae bacterium]
MKTGLIFGGVVALLGIVALSAQVRENRTFATDLRHQNILSTNLVAAQHRDYILLRKVSGLYI